MSTDESLPVGRWPRALTGIPAMIASALCFAVMAGLIKAAARGVPTAQIVFLRNVFHVLLFLPLWWTLTERRVGNRRLLVVRSVVGLAALEAYAWTLARMPLADAWILQSMNPVFVALFAPWLLRERTQGTVWAALVLGLSGAVLIVRPGLRMDVVPGVVGVLGGLFAGLAYLTVRTLRRTDEPLTIVMAFPLVAGPLSLPFALAVWRWPSPAEWAAVAASALAAAGGQVLMTVGLRTARAAPATTATYSGFVFAALLGWLAFAEPPAWTTLAGALSIFAGVLLLARRRGPERAAEGDTVPAGAGDPPAA